MLVVDDCGVNYVGKQHANHLLHALEEHYEISTDWAEKLDCGITIAWDYINRTVDLSMPNYIPAALHKYNHPAPKQPQHAPSPWTRPSYGAKQQIAPPPDNSLLLGPKGTKQVQQVTGTLLFYSRAVDSTLLVALGSTSVQQFKATQQTEMELNQLLDYCHTYPSATIPYSASNLVLQLHSNATFQSQAKASLENTM